MVTLKSFTPYYQNSFNQNMVVEEESFLFLQIDAMKMDISWKPLVLFYFNFT